MHSNVYDDEVEELPAAVEKLLLQVQLRHTQRVNKKVRWWLHEAGEERAIQVLTEVDKVEPDTIYNLCGYLISKLQKPLSPPPLPALSDGLSDATLLALDLDIEGTISERPMLMVVSSQGSNESVECRSTLARPPSSLSFDLVEDQSSQKKRSSKESSNTPRAVKTKLFEFFNQSKPAFSTCVSTRPFVSNSVCEDARKLESGECAFRYKSCASQTKEFATTDPEWNRAFGELSFTKRFLVLDHCKEPEQYPSVKELKILKTMAVPEVDNRLYHQLNRDSHTAMRDWSKLREGGHLVFTCNVTHSGKYEFSGPRFENGGTPLQRAFGQENVLRVNFEDTAPDHYMILDRYRCLGIHGIHCGLKRFVFYAYKDADSKKKQGVSKKATYGCRSVFLAIDSYASADLEDPEFMSFRSISAARSYLMHPTVPSFAKSISRLQLALSQTTQIPLDFDAVHVEYIDDIPCLDENGNVVRDSTNNKALIHTDGCGYISKNLATLIQDTVIKGVKRPEKADPKYKQEYPLMMQVRGFHQGNVWKGVHVVNLKLPDNTIQVRRSMLKVERDAMLSSATFNSFELCNTSRKPSEARLFQHLILLLKLGGVKDEVFIKYVEAAVEKLRLYFTNPFEALNVVAKNVDNHTNAETACEMLLSGVKPGNEPFLQKVLLEMVKSKLQGYPLGKVHVPRTAYLMGCADPTGLLERHQVAILFGDGTPICRQKVLVYKPPGLHQGDVHVFEATWNKEIEAVVGSATYGIMFSTKGARSITDEMAGSDLDGDQYWVSWNPELVDSFTPCAPWEPPNAQDEEPLPRPLDEDTFETLHFNKFIQARFDPSKIKGMSANAWLTLTDHMLSCNVKESEKLHAKERIPLIVNLFYDSLDADKSGKEVKWSKELQCNSYPHFLEKNNEMSADKKTWNGSVKLPVKKYHQYTSTSVLGRVYDLVKKEDFNTILEVNMDSTFAIEGYSDYLNYWNIKFGEYKKMMHTQFQKSEELESKKCASESIFSHYKKIFLGEGKCEKQLLQEASAIYTVVYTDSINKDRLTLQFAWRVAGRELCLIYAQKTSGPRGSFLPLSRENLECFLKRH